VGWRRPGLHAGEDALGGELEGGGVRALGGLVGGRGLLSQGMGGGSKTTGAGPLGLVLRRSGVVCGGIQPQEAGKRLLASPRCPKWLNVATRAPSKKVSAPWSMRAENILLQETCMPCNNQDSDEPSAVRWGRHHSISS